MRDVDQPSRFIEVAILSDKDVCNHGQYHLVVRDSGIGMSEETVKSALGVLGKGTKLGKGFIGQFGVGFYSMHAICLEVVVASKAEGAPSTTWRYVPREKTYYRLTDEEQQVLLRQDFENHPRGSRQRSRGTSVYLRLDVQRFFQCRSWLKPADLARRLRHEGILVPSSLYVADFIENPVGNKIYDFRKRDLTDESLSLGTAPWNATEAELDKILPRLFEQLLPYTEPTDFPRDSFSFRTPVDDGFVSGFLYLVDPNAEGFIDLYLKGLHVETAHDLAPPCAYHVFGLVDITPGSSFDAAVLAARDHVVRNDSYTKVCVAVEDACVDLFETRGKALLAELGRSVQISSGANTVFHDLCSQLNKSTTYRVLCSFDRMYRSLFADIPETLNKLITAPACPEALKAAVMQFVKRSAGGIISVSQENLSAVLQGMQKRANESHEEQRAGQHKLRTAPGWNPRATARFFEKVGPYLPFMIYRREQQSGGQTGFQVERVPLEAVKLLDAQSATVLKVLTNGSPADYLVRDTGVSLVVQPQSDEDLIALCLVRETCFPDLELDFVAFEKDIFQNMLTKDEWAPLVDLLKSIVSVHNQACEAKDMVDADARGCSPDYVSLLDHIEQGRRTLVINGYNDLMKALKDRYRLALERSDAEVIEITGLVLHELVHHASPAIAARPAEERHVVGTRTELLKAVLSMVEKYTDFKLRK